MAILSIQSHVAYGHVGNRSAVFPLELLGFDVWPINTVQFSNHTGYPSWKGEIYSDRQVELVWSGIMDRGVAASCDAVLSGYLGDAGVGRAILSAVADVKAANPRALYCCDPVMGDYGPGFYVRPGIPEFLRSYALRAADIVTPNQYEAEILTETVISTVEDAKAAARALRGMGPRAVLITSFKPDGGGSEGGESEGVSMFLQEGDDSYVVTTPELPFSPAPNGAGDLTAALFLGHYLRSGEGLAALELMADSVYSVLERSWAEKSRELRLVESREAIENPRRRFEARRV